MTPGRSPWKQAEQILEPDRHARPEVDGADRDRRRPARGPGVCSKSASTRIRTASAGQTFRRWRMRGGIADVAEVAHEELAVALDRGAIGLVDGADLEQRALDLDRAVVGRARGRDREAAVVAQVGERALAPRARHEGDELAAVGLDAQAGAADRLRARAGDRASRRGPRRPTRETPAAPAKSTRHSPRDSTTSSGATGCASCDPGRRGAALLASVRGGRRQRDPGPCS